MKKALALSLLFVVFGCAATYKVPNIVKKDHMSKDVDFTIAHTGSFLDRPAARVVTQAATMTADTEDRHYVSTGVNYTDEQLAALSKQSDKAIERFELIQGDSKIKTLTISGGQKLSGVHALFEDGTQKAAGMPLLAEQGGDTQSRSITFHDDELVTKTEIHVIDWKKELDVGDTKIDGVTLTAALGFRTNFGQKYAAVSCAIILVSKFGKSYTDDTKGALVGVYGIAGSDELLSIGLILRPMEDVVEYRFLDVQYDLDDFECVSERMLSLKEQTIINDSNATVNSQVKFAHSYTETSNFSNTHGLKAGVKTDIKAGIPFLAEGKVEVSGEYSCQFEWGKGVTTSKTDEWTATISAPPNSRLRGRATVTESTISVPYRADLQITKIDGSTEIIRGTSGVYKGVNVSDFRVNIEEVPD